MRGIALLVGILLITSCKTELKKDTVLGTVAEKAMVVSARAEASAIGVDVMRKGGNAFDAMVATELALAVAYPIAGNIGGGGFMIYRKSDGAIGALDYREKAPLASNKDMYLDIDGNVIPDKSTLGAMAVGVPGTVAGLFEAHRRFGSLPIEEIIQPVIDLARRGVVVTQFQANYLNMFQPEFEIVNEKKILFSKQWAIGDTIKHESFAKTLEAIQKNGKEEFYIGSIAEKMVEFIQAYGGIITLEDLAKYEAKWRTPIVFSYDDLKIISMSPPSSGGICLAQILKMIEPFDLHEFGHNTTKMMQVLIEAERRSYADRSYYLGDPDFVNVPVDELIEGDYLKQRMGDFSFQKATPSLSVGYGDIQVDESEETTHYSIVDPFGNAVSVTTTLNGAYGSKLYSNELGFFFNNEMDDFSVKPGVPNSYGLIGAEANAIAPEKRMLSSMTPTIVLKGDKLHMVVGTPGGSTIITSVLQTILNVHEFGMSAQEAVNAPRFHHQWLPDSIRIEKGRFDHSTITSLENLGYHFDTDAGPTIGKMEAILVLSDGRLEGGADPRGDDKALGF